MTLLERIFGVRKILTIEQICIQILFYNHFNVRITSLVFNKFNFFLIFVISCININPACFFVEPESSEMYILALQTVLSALKMFLADKTGGHTLHFQMVS